MAEVNTNSKELVLDDSVKVNKKGEAILGVLEGPCADVINPTRNDRQYDEELWDRVFKDDIINEYFSCGGILGELDHPSDRTETDTSKVAICMPEKPKRGKDGKLYARFDILDTPNGRIAYTLAKYGYKLGVSSRGDGDVYEAFDGKEHVDPKTYSLKAFDLVLLPAVKAARLTLKESVGNKTFKQALKESLDSATKSDKQIMLETLDRLNIDYKDTMSSNKKKVIESVSPISDGSARNNGEWLMKELQDQIRKNKELTESLANAQEQLSVCYAKEAKYEDRISNLQTNSSKDTDEVKSLNSKIKTLTEQLSEKDKVIQKQRVKLITLTESTKTQNSNKKVLNEQLNKNVVESKEKDLRIKKLQENLLSEREQSAEQTRKLTESIEELKRDKEIKAKEYSSKLARASKLLEHYKQTVNDAKDRYIESKAKMVGISAIEVKNRLTENYSFSDIDKVCDDLQGYKIALGKLPVALQNTKVKMRVNESIEPLIRDKSKDDTVDDSLLRLIDRLD
nr:MAG TPA: Prohead core protein serine protease [Caudoviricetes sp.]